MRAGLGLLCCAPALWAHAGPSPITVTNTLVVEGRTDNGNDNPADDDFSVVVDRLNLQAGATDLNLQLRLDAVGFGGADPRAPYETDVRPERITARYTRGDWELTAGDYPRQLGRGIVLSVRKVDEVGLDLSLRGADVRYAPEGHTFSVFGGVLNPSNLDAVSLAPVEDPGDLVAGVAYELGTIDQVVIGAHGLYLQAGEGLIAESLDYTVSGGLYAELSEILPGLSVYAEADVQSRRLIGESELGFAAYLTADASIGDLALLVEGLWLADFEQRGSTNTALGSRFALNQVPTLERVDQEVPTNREVRGVRARAEYAVSDGDWIVYVNGVLRLNPLTEDVALRQIHGYAGAEHHFDEDTSKIIASAGYRDEAQDDVGQIKTMIHGELDVVKAVAEGLALHVTGNVEARSAATREGRWVRGSTFIGGEWAGVGGVTVEIGYDTEDPSQRQLFVAGLLALTLSDAFQARAAVGTQRGGIKCANGVCRDFPEFAGARVELVARL